MFGWMFQHCFREVGEIGWCNTVGKVILTSFAEFRPLCFVKSSQNTRISDISALFVLLCFVCLFVCCCCVFFFFFFLGGGGGAKFGQFQLQPLHISFSQYFTYFFCCLRHIIVAGKTEVFETWESDWMCQLNELTEDPTTDGQKLVLKVPVS